MCQTHADLSLRGEAGEKRSESWRLNNQANLLKYFCCTQKAATWDIYFPLASDLFLTLLWECKTASTKRPHVYKKQYQNTKPRALYLNTVNHRELVFIWLSFVPLLILACSLSQANSGVKKGQWWEETEGATIPQTVLVWENTAFHLEHKV